MRYHRQTWDDHWPVVVAAGSCRGTRAAPRCRADTSTPATAPGPAGPCCTHRKSAEQRKEGNVLFNDALNTFYLRLYGLRHMVKDHSDSEKGNPLPPHRLLFPINSKGFLYAPSHRQESTYHTAFVTPIVEHWLEREIAQWVHPMKDRSHHEWTLKPQSYISLPKSEEGKHSVIGITQSVHSTNQLLKYDI